MIDHRIRNFFISIFCVIWIVVFHYESMRHFYLQPLLKRALPKLPLLFPPAGWIMFFNVDDSAGFVEVYGVTDGEPQRIDPHDIIQTRTIAYDNIHRNILSEVANPQLKPAFCKFMERKFPNFDNFLVTVVYYPSFTKTPHRKIQKVIYQCSKNSPSF